MAPQHESVGCAAERGGRLSGFNLGQRNCPRATDFARRDGKYRGSDCLPAFVSECRLPGKGGPSLDLEVAGRGGVGEAPVLLALGVPAVAAHLAESLVVVASELDGGMISTRLAMWRGT